MSVVTQQFNLSEYSSSSLSTVFKAYQENFSAEQACLPLSFTAANDHITLQQNSDTSTTHALELVVFEELLIAQLLDITVRCGVEIQTLHAQNNRIGKTSYRFNVKSNNVEQSTAALSKWCAQNKQEAALLTDAPQLSVAGLLVMDMDSTTIEIECIDEIATLAGVGKQVAEVTELAMQGKLDFAQSLHQRVATLANASENILAQVAEDIPLMPGLTTLVPELQKNGWKVAIASGGFTYFADHLKSMLNLDAAYANTLEIVDGKLTGKVLGAVVDAQAKANVLKQLQVQNNIADTQTVAMGDGANDLVMMAAAHLGIAFHAKPLVQEKADSSIQFSGLDTMLHWLK